jgi:NAD(P)-dependent dehydrogenase (short-subunit alcohol dehydrogenase family)
VVDLNLKAAFLGHSAARAMTNGGSIVNISSAAPPPTGHWPLWRGQAALENRTRTAADGANAAWRNAVAPGV